MHDFILSLPQGYSTRLGPSGLALSGGQRQRLALARAILRDPAVLILDESTSALDATSRLLVFEAIRQERKRRTTVVVTHDLSMVRHSDYIYVMKDGRCVEEGFREDLEAVVRCPVCWGDDYSGPGKGCKGEWKDLGGCGRGEFRAMVERQMGMGGSLPPVEPVDQMRETSAAVERAMTPAPVPMASALQHRVSRRASLWTKSVVAPWEVDAIRDIMGNSSSSARALAIPEPKSHLSPYKHRVRYESRATPPSAFKAVKEQGLARSASTGSAYAFGQSQVKSASTTSLPSPSPYEVSFSHPLDLARRSMTFEPNGWASDSPVMVSFRQRRASGAESASDEDGDDDDQESVQDDKKAMDFVRMRASGRRQPSEKIDIVIPDPVKEETQAELPSIFAIALSFWSTLPDKRSTIIGLTFSFITGALTPIFSFLLARLVAQISLGKAADTKLTNTYGLLVFLTAFSTGVANGLQYYLLEMSAMRWVASLRARALSILLKQDKSYFDKEENSPERLVSILITDGDDARSLLASVAGPFFVVVAMFSVGLLWAMIRGWQLTLVGIAIGPVFGGAMILQSSIVARYEIRNKRAREEVARRYYEAVASVRVIRAMALEGVFEKYFRDAADAAMKAGIDGSFVAGLGLGVAHALIYLAEAVLFYMGAVLISNGTYSYLRLAQVLNLVVFTVTIGSQMFTFGTLSGFHSVNVMLTSYLLTVPKIAKSKQAAIDLGKVLSLNTQTTETRGAHRFPIDGEIAFRNVSFAYPQRSDVPILRGLSSVIQYGECVAVVGTSGSGKSTTAALLQRLYEPTAGRITIGGFNIADMDIKWLREHVAIVSQTPQLFDATIAENIAYGCDTENVPYELIQRAARDAHLHDFILSLPKGYDTTIGENASLLSGGQAQRLSIARALFNGRANIMIFDECTSALDPANAAAVMETIMDIKDNRTCILITHKDRVMRMCDRILMVDEGLIAEEGTYDALMQRRGKFFQLASAREWADLD